MFPLVGVALAALVRGRTDPVAWAVRLAAYVYATFYTALDVISGVAAGYVTHELGPGVPRPEAVSLLFRIGTPLGEIGSWALLVMLRAAGRRPGRAQRRPAPSRWCCCPAPGWSTSTTSSLRGVVGMALHRARARPAPRRCGRDTTEKSGREATKRVLSAS